jgi:hypothetical protein
MTNVGCRMPRTGLFTEPIQKVIQTNWALQWEWHLPAIAGFPSHWRRHQFSGPAP